MADDYAGSTSTTGLLNVGGSVTGNIEITGDEDWFMVALVAGQTYQFDLKGSDTGDGTLQSPSLRLMNSAGSVLLSDYDSGGYGGPGNGYGSKLVFTASTGGTYYLSSAASGNELDTYKLSDAQIGAVADDYGASTATIGVVAVGSSVLGGIETGGDADWFKVNLVAGQVYQFDLMGAASGQGSLPVANLQLFNGTGAFLLSDYASVGYTGSSADARLTYRATTSGTYYLASDPVGNDQVGTYKLSVASLGSLVDDYAATTATIGTLASGGSAVGNIETSLDKDWFKIALTEGVTYRFGMMGEATGQGSLQNA